MRGLRERQEWQFFAHLPRAGRPLAFAWWALVVLRSVLPPVFAITTGAVIGAVVASGGGSTTGPLVAMGVVFVALQVSAPLHQTVSESLGNRMSAWLYDDLTDSCSTPPGIGHLEDPTLAGDITVAREFDSGHHGPPMEVNLPFIAIGLIDLGTGRRLGRRAGRLHLVGAAGARRRVGRYPLAAARERDLEGPQHRRGARGQPARRVRLPARRRPAAGQGAAGLRAVRLGPRPLHRAAPAAVRPPAGGHPAARAVAGAQRAAGLGGQRRRPRRAGPRRLRAARSPSTGRSSTPRSRSAPR